MKIQTSVEPSGLRVLSIGQILIMAAPQKEAAPNQGLREFDSHNGFIYSVGKLSFVICLTGIKV